MYRNSQITRTIAATMLFFLIAVSLIFGAPILNHTEHEHNHNGAGGVCTTCVQLQSTGNHLKQITAHTGGALSLVFQLFTVATVLFFIICRLDLQTPVNLKTRMNQ